MPDYEKMYLLLFNSITDALEALEDNDIKKAQLILKRAQITAEDEYRILNPRRVARKRQRRPPQKTAPAKHPCAQRTPVAPRARASVDR